MEPSGVALYRYCCYVLHGLNMAGCNTVMPSVFRNSYGTHLFYYMGEIVKNYYKVLFYVEPFSFLRIAGVFFDIANESGLHFCKPLKIWDELFYFLKIIQAKFPF